MAFVYINQEPRLDVTEALVLGSLMKSYNPSESGKADIIILCKDIFYRADVSKQRGKFNTLWHYYNDQQKDLFIENVFKPLMGKDVNGKWNYDLLCQQNITPIVKIVNFVKRLIDKQATLYDDPPTRTILDNEKATEAYNKIVHDLRLDAVMQNAERYQTLFQSCFLRPVLRDGEMDIDIMLPTFIYALPSPNNKSKAIGYFWLLYDDRKPDDPMAATWYYISDTEYFWWTWEKSNGVIPTQGSAFSAFIKEHYSKQDEEDPGKSEGNQLNETGIVRLATNWVGDCIISDPGDSLINFQDNVNLVETMKQNSLVFQAFPILMLKNFETKDKDGNPKRINIGPWNAIAANTLAGDNDASAEWVAPATAIDQFIKALEHDIDYYLLTAGVPKNLILDAATSGTALAERNRDIKEIRKSKVNQYKAVEQEIYTIIAKWVNKWGDQLEDNPGALPEDGALSIDYADPQNEMPTEKEQLETSQLKIDMNLTSPVRLLMEQNPDLDEQQAIELLRKIKSENDMVNSIFGGQQIGDMVKAALGQKPQDESNMS